MKTMKIALIVVAVVTSFVVLGQNPPAVGAITGSVRDTSGNVMPGVTVTAVGPGGTARAFSNERGSYVIPNIQVGAYTVSATLPGFQTEVSRVVVSANISASAEFTLQLGQWPGTQGPLRPYPSPSNPNIQADRQTRQGTTVQYRGNVVMTTNGMELRADELGYDTNSGMGDVRGNVKFRVLPSTVRVVPLSN